MKLWFSARSSEFTAASLPRSILSFTCHWPEGFHPHGCVKLCQFNYPHFTVISSKLQRLLCYPLKHFLLYMCLVTQLCPTLCDLMDCSPPGSSVHEIFPGKNTGMGSYALLQGIFPTQGLNLPHCRWILYHLSHQGSPLLYIMVNHLGVCFPTKQQVLQAQISGLIYNKKNLAKGQTPTISWITNS